MQILSINQLVSVLANVECFKPASAAQGRLSMSYCLHSASPTSCQPALAHVTGLRSALGPAADYRLFAITDHNTGKTKPGMVAVVGETVCI